MNSSFTLRINESRKKPHRRLSLDSLEQRQLLAADITFSEPVEYSAGESPNDKSLGDWNGDGVIDIAQTNFGGGPTSGDVSVFMGLGGGEFASEVRYEANDKPGAIDNYDVNNDGHMDLIVGNVDSNDISILLNAGDGTFSKQTDYHAGLFPGAVRMIDLDMDGNTDIVAGVALRRGSNDGEIIILKGNGDGTFATRQKLVAGHRSLGVIDDFDGDGDLDLAVKQFEGGNAINVHLRGDDGIYGDPVSLSPVGRPISVTGADFNNDGIIDLASSNDRGSEVSIFLGIGDGMFQNATVFEAGNAPNGIRAEDLDLDGDTDIIVFNSNSRFNILVNDGLGGFDSRITTSLSVGTRGIQVADLNEDAKPDLIHTTSTGIAVMLNETEVEMVRRPGDVNGDGIFDSSDLLLVFQAGEYEDGNPGNSTFEEGDWDGDGDFTTSDLLLAFREGHYVSTAIPYETQRIFVNGRDGGFDRDQHVNLFDNASNDFWNEYKF